MLKMFHHTSTILFKETPFKNPHPPNLSQLRDEKTRFLSMKYWLLKKKKYTYNGAFKSPLNWTCSIAQLFASISLCPSPYQMFQKKSEHSGPCPAPAVTRRSKPAHVFFENKNLNKGNKT